MSVWVWVELNRDGADQTSLELVSLARSLTPEVSAIAIGSRAAAAVPALGKHGATTVFVQDDTMFDEYPVEPSAHVISELAREHRPTMILFGHTYDSRVLAGRLQGILGSTLVTNVDEVKSLDHVRTSAALRLSPGRPGNLRGGIGGMKRVDVKLTGSLPHLVTVRPRAFASNPVGQTARLVKIDVAVPEHRRRVRVVERDEAEGTRQGLDQAQVVVAGGRGMQGPEGFELLARLASMIGNAAVGATRPVVDAGWMPFSHQIGQTGKTVEPLVYLAFGISGAAQHVIGMRNAAAIVAVNTDAAAPIFDVADFGIVGDARRIVDDMITEISHQKRNQIETD